MNKFLFFALLLFSFGSFGVAQERQDSIERNLSEVEIIETRASVSTPVAFTNLNASQINSSNHGKDLTFILQNTPSVVVTSDAGTGIGYTSMRVRGTDATRINVTANGIPVNDSESHSLYWVNMPDLASSVKNIQIQRGVGTSTFGAGAFGASVNILTDMDSDTPYSEMSFGYGAYNTQKETIKIGSGKIVEHWNFDLRLSNIGSNGYIDRASARLRSFYAQAGYFDATNRFKIIAFGGNEVTYHAWNYASKDDMQKYGRRYNSCGFMFKDVNGVSHYYDDQTDHYTQFNYQMHYTHLFSNYFKFNIAAHYTKGDGYYKEYKTDRYAVEYKLSEDYDVQTDLIRKKAMDNSFGGGVFSLNYSSRNVNAVLGGAFNYYDGDHFGKVLWTKSLNMSEPELEYYRNTGRKSDANIFIKGEWCPISDINVYADMQYRHINYRINGFTDKYNWSDLSPQSMNVDDNFNFFNPKAGMSWNINRFNRIYASVGVAHKEPTRNNYTDGHLFVHPKAEKLIDYEAGYSISGKLFSVGANFYYMNYKDQLVLTGELNEIGEALSDNVDSSYRMGVELVGGLKYSGFDWSVGATLSRNKIRDFVEVIYDNEDPTKDKIVTPLGDTNIAFSPNVIVNNTISYSWKGIRASLMSHYVGKQYMSNYNCEDHKLDAYFVNDLDLSYTFAKPKIKNITLGMTVYNIFNEKYESNGYAGSGFYYDEGKAIRYNYAGYAAQAPTNVMFYATLKF